MFSHDTHERLTGRIHMGGFSARAVDELKKFLYEGHVGHLKDVGAELYELAVMYELPRLGAVCAKALPELVSESNFCEFFQLAQLHGLPELKAAAVRFAHRNPQVLRGFEGRGLGNHHCQSARACFGVLCRSPGHI